MPQPLIKRPERKKESPHEYHTLDDNWCYDCNKNINDEGEDFPYGANQWNKCHDAFTLYEEARYGKVMEGGIIKLSGIKVGVIVILYLSNGMLSNPIEKNGWVERITEDDIIISNEHTWSHQLDTWMSRATPRIEWRIPKENIIYYRIIEIGGRVE